MAALLIWAEKNYTRTDSGISTGLQL